MNKMCNIDKAVRYVLENSILSREDDFILIGNVYKYFKIDIKNMSMFEILKSARNNKYPTFESITRARRKICSINPELTSEKIKIARDKEQNIYINYNRDV